MRKLKKIRPLIIGAIVQGLIIPALMAVLIFGGMTLLAS